MLWALEGYFRQAVLRILGQRMCYLGLLLWKDAPCLPAIHFLPPLRDKGAARGLPSLSPTLLLSVYSVYLDLGECRQCLLIFAGLSHNVSPNLSAWL